MDKKPTGAPRLDSWKEIAAYLRRGARTVQRWEREEGLPVHRLQHGKLGSVYAYPAELDAWFASRGARPRRRPIRRPLPRDTPSVAVLPFADLSPQADQAYFCDGIAEEIIHALSRVEGLRTASRTVVVSFPRRRASTAAQSAQELGVRSLLDGSVRKSGDRLRIAVQLIDAETGFPLWAERYDRTLNDVFAVQDEIAESVVRALQVTLTPREERALQTPPTTDVGAYECYLRGRNYYYEYSPRGMEFAIQMFVRAIELDPQYAHAYAGLADCWSYTYLYSDRSDAVREQADWASARAQEMDPQSAQAQASRGLSLSLSGRNEEADQAFEKAVQLDPDLFEAHYFRARHCFALGRLAEAAAAFEQAMRARPDDYQSPLLLAQIEDDLGRRDRATAARKQGIAIAERRLQLNPDDARALYMAANGLAALGRVAAVPASSPNGLAPFAPTIPCCSITSGASLRCWGSPMRRSNSLEAAARKGLRQKGGMSTTATCIRCGICRGFGNS